MIVQIVLDSSVLFRTLISRGDILKILFDSKLKIFAPLNLKGEFINNKEEILKKSKLSKDKFNALFSLIFKRITFVPSDNYRSFLPKARQLLGKHEKDEDFVALCLSKNIKLWTYEKLLFDLGFGISTKELSKRISQ